MNVEEIPHAAVRFTQHDHRVQFLGDRSLWAIGFQPCPRISEQTRIFQPFGFRNHGVTDPDINLHVKAGTAQPRLNRRAQSAVGVLLTDRPPPRFP
jgi:hypothetical protein